uniref:C-type lectin domain-containing protein n=1 Tax=Caenorhabditis tropicalis TaxID=1561998 RepID=A0A1I7V4B9_9PELO
MANSMFRPQRPSRHEECSCENHEEVPCEENGESTTTDYIESTVSSSTEKTTTVVTTTVVTTPSTTTQPTTTVPSSTTSTSPLPTTTPRICRNSGYTAFKRKNGWWCGQFYNLQVPGSQPYQGAVNNCFLNRDVLSSFETDEEWNHWRERIYVSEPVNVTAIWLAASYNESIQQWYWSDGNAIPTMEPQPTVVTPGGQVAWFTYEGDRVLKVSNTSTDSTIWVNGFVCGHLSSVPI